MVAAKQDFEFFVRWLYQRGRKAPADVRRLALLCLQNLDGLANATRQRNARPVFLVPLLCGMAGCGTGGRRTGRKRHVALEPTRQIRSQSVSQIPIRRGVRPYQANRPFLRPERQWQDKPVRGPQVRTPWRSRGSGSQTNPRATTLWRCMPVCSLQSSSRATATSLLRTSGKAYPRVAEIARCTSLRHDDGNHIHAWLQRDRRQLCRKSASRASLAKRARRAGCVAPGAQDVLREGMGWMESRDLGTLSVQIDKSTRLNLRMPI